MKFTFHPEAEEEFEASIAYYEQCDPGLGLDFAFEVLHVFKEATDDSYIAIERNDS